MEQNSLVKSKICKKCGIEKHISEFYVHDKMADGHLNFCKNCVKSRVKNYRAENIDRVREYDRSRGTRVSADRYRELYAENKSRYKSYKTAWQKRNKEKRIAQIALCNSVRDGKTIKLPCVVCGNKESEGHHLDYSKPLEVIWLCRVHHAEEHKRLNKIRREECAAKLDEAKA